MTSTGWKVTDSGPDTRIAEFRVENPGDSLVTYEEAKAKALHMMKDHVAPYLARIEQLEDDLFSETGALPPFKAWKYRQIVVAAKTKKRAIELANVTRYEFSAYWVECDGDWWYHLARQEAVWGQDGTGIFYRSLNREEAEQVLESHILPYRTMDIHVLLAQLGQTSTVTGVSSQGTPYEITTMVERFDWDEGAFVLKRRSTTLLEYTGVFGYV